MNALKEVRRQRGWSQRELAARAVVSFRGLQLLEHPGHNWRVATVERVAEALGRPGRGVELAVDHFLRTPEDSIQDISLRIVLDGFTSWKTHLFDFVDAFRSSQNEALIQEPPVVELDARLRALCASATEALCCETNIRPPAWCAGIPALDVPWFVSGIENLKVMALVESPAWFRARRIFVLSNFLSRV
ncbi:MAG: helix-turn-helix transcriptional regulator [Verrucomicrobia bacterium]|jgi:transcriptional regulator with XRE-family HTH domain|nr:helix-turn-helix transcriptional regulator [Verrucomicrobiota bacterium]MBT7066263.1 helix-turn-helix transcriptional regulator [Verrucomicrobiota bacterium]MBT7700248.1 helix-turn-helix transcriptional regulator [Verrucomicrobiota bacterium]